MIKPKKFKKSIFGGFNRREVISYINELDEIITTLEAENGVLRNDNAVLEAKVDDTVRQINDIKDLSNEITEMGDKHPISGTDNVNRIDGFEVREDIITDLMDEDVSRYETKDVHDLSLDIGNILLAARECADDIIKEAEDKSKEMKISALKSSEDLIQTLNKTQIYIKSLSDDINEAIGKFEAE